MVAKGKFPEDKVGCFKDSGRLSIMFGNVLGVIENPHFPIEATKLIHERED